MFKILTTGTLIASKKSLTPTTFRACYYSLITSSCPAIYRWSPENFIPENSKNCLTELSQTS